MPSLLDDPAFIAACKPKKLSIPAKPKRKQRPEAAIQNNIIAYLRGSGWFVIRINSSMLPGAQSHSRVPSYVAHTPRGKLMAGHPDVVAYRDGQAVFFEIKAPAGKLSDRQKRFAEVLQEYGMASHVVRSVDDVRQILQEVPSSE